MSSYHHDHMRVWAMKGSEYMLGRAKLFLKNSLEVFLWESWTTWFFLIIFLPQKINYKWIGLEDDDDDWKIARVSVSDDGDENCECVCVKGVRTKRKIAAIWSYNCELLFSITFSHMIYRKINCKNIYVYIFIDRISY